MQADSLWQNPSAVVTCGGIGLAAKRGSNVGLVEVWRKGSAKAFRKAAAHGQRAVEGAEEEEVQGDVRRRRKKGMCEEGARRGRAKRA